MVRRAVLGSTLLLLPACAATKAVSGTADDFLSGFQKLTPEEVEADIQKLESGFQLVQSREKPPRPRNEREALEQLRARRQDFLRRIR